MSKCIATALRASRCDTAVARGERSTVARGSCRRTRLMAAQMRRRRIADVKVGNADEGHSLTAELKLVT